MNIIERLALQKKRCKLSREEYERNTAELSRLEQECLKELEKQLNLLLI